MKFLPLIVLSLSLATLTGCQIEVMPLGQEDIVADDKGTTNGNELAIDTGTDIETVATSVTLYWSTPQERVNGDALSTNDIGGYEIRYKTNADTSYQNIVLNDAMVDQYSIDGLNDATLYQFEVAVFDTNGIYSDFVVATAN